MANNLSCYLVAKKGGDTFCSADGGMPYNIIKTALEADSVEGLAALPENGAENGGPRLQNKRAA